MVAILEEIVQLLVGGITAISEGIGTGLSTLVQDVFLVTDEAGKISGLSTFGGVVAIFGGEWFATP